MRWAPAPQTEMGLDLWKPIPFVWDFGARVLEPKAWKVWLDQLYSSSKSKPPEMRQDGVHEEFKVTIQGRLEPYERKTLYINSTYHFKGRNIVFSSNNASSLSFINVWDFSVNGHSQMRLTRDDEGIAHPWNALEFCEDVIPFDLRFDVCQSGGTMSIDVENTSTLANDVVVEIPGTRLIKMIT